MEWSPEGNRLATASYEAVQLFDPTPRTLLYRREMGGQHEVRFSPDGRLLAVALRSGQIAFVRAADGKPILWTDTHKGPVESIAWSPDGRRFATCGSDGEVAIWDSATATKLMAFFDRAPIQHVTWSPDNRRLACITAGSKLHIWGSPELEVTPESTTRLESGNWWPPRMRKGTAMTDANREDQLGEVVADCLKATERGDRPDRDALLSAHPEYGDELRSFFANHDRMRAEAGVAFNDATLPHQDERTEVIRPTADIVGYFGDYELLAEIVRGGMGVVYEHGK